MVYSDLGVDCRAFFGRRVTCALGFIRLSEASKARIGESCRRRNSGTVQVRGVGLRRGNEALMFLCCGWWNVCE